MSQQYTNIRKIMDSLMRHPLMQDIALEAAVDYAVSFMRLVGVPDMFEEKVTYLKVDNYRTLLPCDYYQMIQIRIPDGNTFRYSSDSFHMSECKEYDKQYNSNNSYQDLTYKIQGNVIYTSIKNGFIEVAYEALAVDKEGYPLLPDNSSFTRALQAFIKKEWFTILFDLGKINPAILQNAQQEYAWAVGDCASEFNRLSIDKMETFTNSWNTLIMRASEHDSGFKNNGTKERIKLH